jgi:hypothetical protein
LITSSHKRKTQWLARNARWATILATIAIVLFSLGLHPDLISESERRFNSRLKEKLQNTQEKIPLTHLTDFPWRQVCFANGHTLISDVQRDAKIYFGLRDSIRWWLYGPVRESHGTLVFITPDSVIPIKLEWTKELFFSLGDRRYGAKHSCDHDNQTRLFVTHCERNDSEPLASKFWCRVTLI